MYVSVENNLPATSRAPVREVTVSGCCGGGVAGLADFPVSSGGMALAAALVKAGGENVLSARSLKWSVDSSKRPHQVFRAAFGGTQSGNPANVNHEQDPRIACVVYAFQAAAGLSRTGVVDAETGSVMLAVRDYNEKKGLGKVIFELFNLRNSELKKGVAVGPLMTNPNTQRVFLQVYTALTGALFIPGTDFTVVNAVIAAQTNFRNSLCQVWGVRGYYGKDTGSILLVKEYADYQLAVGERPITGVVNATVVKANIVANTTFGKKWAPNFAWYKNMAEKASTDKNFSHADLIQQCNSRYPPNYQGIWASFTTKVEVKTEDQVAAVRREQTIRAVAERKAAAASAAAAQKTAAFNRAQAAAKIQRRQRSAEVDRRRAAEAEAARKATLSREAAIKSRFEAQGKAMVSAWVPAYIGVKTNPPLTRPILAKQVATFMGVLKRNADYARVYPRGRDITLHTAMMTVGSALIPRTSATNLVNFGNLNLGTSAGSHAVAGGVLQKMAATIQAKLNTVNTTLANNQQQQQQVAAQIEQTTQAQADVTAQVQETQAQVAAQPQPDPAMVAQLEALQAQLKAMQDQQAAAQGEATRLQDEQAAAEAAKVEAEAAKAQVQQISADAQAGAITPTEVVEQAASAVAPVATPEVAAAVVQEAAVEAVAKAEEVVATTSDPEESKAATEVVEIASKTADKAATAVTQLSTKAGGMGNLLLWGVGLFVAYKLLSGGSKRDNITITDADFNTPEAAAVRGQQQLAAENHRYVEPAKYRADKLHHARKLLKYGRVTREDYDQMVAWINRRVGDTLSVNRV